MDRDLPKVAIVGLGPRGLGALEALGESLLQSGQKVQVDVYDPTSSPGAGPNFCPDESRLCLLNIPFRDIAIRPPSFTSCGDFDDWVKGTSDPDSFPTRPDLGRYLEGRLADVLALDVLNVARVAASVSGIKRDAQGWWLQVADRWAGPYAEVLLTLGQPKTKPDPQLSDWMRHVDGSDAELATAYPARDLAERAKDWQGKTVAIRGLGLSVFDVLRSMTCALGGRFEADRYHASGHEPAKIIPFSLDGKPPFPKPKSTAIDAVFDPLANETDGFAAALGSLGPDATPADVQAAISECLGPVVGRILNSATTPCCPEQIAMWLRTEWKAPGTQVQETYSPLDTLDIGIALANGDHALTIGYTVGQVWRKWQDDLRKGFNPATLSAETSSAIIGFDEGLKRYSYGPPVASALELRALIDAGVVDLAYATDPDITLIDGGWRLECDGPCSGVQVMVDSVMPSANLSGAEGPLLPELIESGCVVPVTKEFGAQTLSDGQVVNAEGAPVPGLSLLGRMALGSVVAVDSLHDCFGEATTRWATGVMARLTERTETPVKVG